jgi:hypothetical protein
VSREYAVFIGRFVQGLELKLESQFRSRDIVGHIHGMAEGLTGETCKLLTHYSGTSWGGGEGKLKKSLKKKERDLHESLKRSRHQF